MARNMVLTYLHLLDPEMTIDVRKRVVFNTFLWDLKVGCSLAALPKSAFLMGFSGVGGWDFSVELMSSG
jgi:hypothetical protein